MQRYSRFARGSLILLLLAGLFAGLLGPRMMDAGAAPQVVQVTTGVVISEFRFRGSNGANDEFVELYNLTTGDINVGGWRLEGGNNAGPTGTRYAFPSGAILYSGQHYLIVGSGYNDAAPGDPSATLSSGITDDGGIALTLSDGTSIVDQVGMSNCAGCYFEGTPLASLGTTNADRGYERKLGGASDSCQDTGDNSADFSLINPSSPQNSSSPWSVCGVPVPATNTPTTTSTATDTPTSTMTGTATATRTITSTGAATVTPAPASALDVLINEVAWMGTSGGRSGDEWIELYNTHATAINLDGWRLTIQDATNPETDLVFFEAGDLLPAGGFFLLARASGGSCNIFTDVAEDKCFSTQLANTGDILRLYDSFDTLIDTANSDGGGWPAGSSSSYSSMERRAKTFDIFSAWVTFAGTPFAHNRDNLLVRGTPKRVNWFTTITATPTRTRTKKPTERPPTPAGRPVINEFLPRPGFDWNQDGKINVYDEFIEIMNIGPVNISIGGWQLDDEEGSGSDPFVLPSITLTPGQRVVFYGSETNILLSDGGDSVRLISSRGVIMDAYTYGIVKVEDQSWCRLPEGRDWYKDCVPTPGLPNSRQGTVPSMPPTSGLQEPICRFSDTLPPDFLFAECNSYGTNMWNSMYWDKDAWQGDRLIPDVESKWLSFIE